MFIAQTLLQPTHTQALRRVQRLLNARRNAKGVAPFGNLTNEQAARRTQRSHKCALHNSVTRPCFASLRTVCIRICVCVCVDAACGVTQLFCVNHPAEKADARAIAKRATTSQREATLRAAHRRPNKTAAEERPASNNRRKSEIELE